MNKSPLSHTVLREVGFRLLEEGRTIRVRAEGYSMYPCISPGSVIYIEPLTTGRLPEPGEIIAWKKDSGFVVHRLIRIEQIVTNKFVVTRGDSCIEEDEPVAVSDIAGRVIEIERPGGKKIQSAIYNYRHPNYTFNRFLIRIISQISRVKRFLTVHPKSKR